MCGLGKSSAHASEGSTTPNTSEPPSDLRTYVFFEIPVEEVHVDGLEAHVEPENKHWTVSKLQQPQDVFVEGLLRREGMK